MSVISEVSSAEFEQHARILLEESVTRTDGRVRSRLNRARQAALSHARGPRLSLLRPWAVMPAGALAAVALMAIVLWPHAPKSTPPSENGRQTLEDMDLLADGDALDLVSDETDGGAFYEWAADQTETSEVGANGSST